MPPTTKLQAARAPGIFAMLQTAFPAAFDELTNQDLLAVAAVSAIGVLATLALARFYPIGDALALLGQFS
jgi:hypothetical protein